MLQMILQMIMAAPSHEQPKECSVEPEKPTTPAARCADERLGCTKEPWQCATHWRLR